MQELRLSFKTTAKHPSFNVSIDGCNANIAIANNEIIIWHDMQYGFHHAEITLVNKDGSMPIVFVDAKLNGVSFRQTLYTMYCNKDNKKQTTTLTTTDNILYLPFINPISQWIASCSEKIPGRLYAHSLYKELAVYYPESVKISDKFPRIMQDYMGHYTDFYVHPQAVLADPYYNPIVPYVALPNLKYDNKALYNELFANLEFLRNTARDPAQNKYNKADTTSNTYWQVFDFIIKSNENILSAEQFPELHKLLAYLNIDEILHGFIGILGPGEYIVPHVDQYEGMEYVMEQYGGCGQLYIPVNFKEGNYFKFTDVGMMPLTGPMLINTQYFSHGLINSSDEYRFAIGIHGSRLNAK